MYNVGEVYILSEDTKKAPVERQGRRGGERLYGTTLASTYVLRPGLRS